MGYCYEGVLICGNMIHHKEVFLLREVIYGKNRFFN
jgi:hypothetical protein